MESYSPGGNLYDQFQWFMLNHPWAPYVLAAVCIGLIILILRWLFQPRSPQRTRNYTRPAPTPQPPASTPTPEPSSDSSAPTREEQLEWAEERRRDAIRRDRLREAEDYRQWRRRRGY